MNYAERAPIPLRPDRTATSRQVWQFIARSALHLARSVGKTHPEAVPFRGEERAVFDWLTRAPVTPATIATTSALTEIELHWLTSLLPISAAANLIERSVKLDLDGVASISIPALNIAQAAFVGEGQPISVLQGTTSTAATLTPFKLGSIVVLTAETLEANANAEAIMRQVLIESVASALDASMFSNAAATASSPAGLLNGISPLTATPSGQNAMAEDLGNIAAALAPVAGASPPIIIASPPQAMVINTVAVNPGMVFSSNALPAKTVVGVVAQGVVTAISAPTISASLHAHIHMAAPASEIVISPSTVAAPAKSMFQTNSVALKLIENVSWARRGASLAWVQNTNW
jgi:hypothetical protein